MTNDLSGRQAHQLLSTVAANIEAFDAAAALAGVARYRRRRAIARRAAGGATAVALTVAGLTTTIAAWESPTDRVDVAQQGPAAQQRWFSVKPPVNYREIRYEFGTDDAGGKYQSAQLATRARSRNAPSEAGLGPQITVSVFHGTGYRPASHGSMAGYATVPTKVQGRVGWEMRDGSESHNRLGWALENGFHVEIIVVDGVDRQTLYRVAESVQVWR